MPRIGDVMVFSSIDPRFRITIPREIRRESNLQVGDNIAFLKKGEEIVMIKVPKDPITQMAGSLSADVDVRKVLREIKEEDLRDEK